MTLEEKLKAVLQKETDATAYLNDVWEFKVITGILSICQEAVDEACKNAKIEECKYWQDAIFSPQSIIAQLSVIDFQLRITELSLPESPKEKL